MVSLAAEISYRPCDQRTCRVDILLSSYLELLFSLHLYRGRSLVFNNRFLLQFQKFVKLAQNPTFLFVNVLLSGMYKTSHLVFRFIFKIYCKDQSSFILRKFIQTAIQLFAFNILYHSSFDVVIFCSELLKVFKFSVNVSFQCRELYFVFVK